MKGAITRFARSHADKAKRYILNSLERQYMEASLSLEAQIRSTEVCTLPTSQRAHTNRAQNYIQDTVPGKIYTGLDKIVPSFRKMRKETKTRADDRGCIDQEKRYHAPDEAAVQRTERACPILRAEHERVRRFLTASVEEARKMAAEDAKIPHMPQPAWVCPTGKPRLPAREPARYPKVTYTHPEPAPKETYMKETRRL